MSLPYFITWTKQNDALTIPFTHCDDYHYYNNSHQKILDLTSISFQASFGLRPSQIIQAVKDQLDSFPMASPKHHFDLKNKVSLKLLDSLNLEGKIFYTVSGAEAIENALKMSRRITGKKKVLAKVASYHGASLGALSITGDWRNKPHATLDQWTIRYPDHREDPHAKQLEKIILKTGQEEISALCLETMTGANGAYRPTQIWMKNVQDLCQKYNIHLILDEVICGFGRTGKSFGFHHYKNLTPDFICLSKAITGGVVPFGAVYTSTAIAKFYDDNILACGLTNFAHPLGLAALNAVIEITQAPSFKNHVDQIILKLENFKKDNTIKADEIRVAGAMMAIDIVHSKTLTDFLDHGLYLLVKENRILIAPILTLPLNLLDEGLTKICEVLRAKQS